MYVCMYVCTPYALRGQERVSTGFPGTKAADD